MFALEAQIPDPFVPEISESNILTVDELPAKIPFAISPGSCSGSPMPVIVHPVITALVSFPTRIPPPSPSKALPPFISRSKRLATAPTPVVANAHTTPLALTSMRDPLSSLSPSIDILLEIVIWPCVNVSVCPSRAFANRIVSAAAVALACCTASRRLSTPSPAFTTSDAVVTVNVAMACYP